MRRRRTLAEAHDHEREHRNDTGAFARVDLPAAEPSEAGFADLVALDELLHGTSVSVGGTEIESQSDRAWVKSARAARNIWGNDGYALYGELSTSSSWPKAG